MSNTKQTVVVLLLMIGLVAAFWWPTLVGGKSLIHGDSIVHGLPLMELHSRILHGDETALWSEKVYGGHAVFAESQGAFAHPLNLLLAWLVPPVYGHNLFHFFCMIIAGIGTLGLCRSLGASVFAGGFAALAVAFATIWVGAQQNLSIAGALAWVPWVFWAMEAWLKRTDCIRAIVFGGMVALVVLAGYPQALHGAIIYMVLAIAPMFLLRDGRAFWFKQGSKPFITGGLAILCCVGFSAVQWLPLLELVSLSHRNNGIGLFLPLFDPTPYYRGLLFTFQQSDVGANIYIPSVGSWLVCMMASLIILVRSPARIKGHLLATVFLIELGMVPASPLSILYESHLIPGLHLFRSTVLYLAIAVIGIAVLAAFAIDGLARCCAQHVTPWRRDYRALALLITFFAAWAIVIYHLYVPAISMRNFIFVGAGIAGVFALGALKRPAVIAAFMFFLLAIECASLRLHVFKFGDISLLQRPEALDFLSQHQVLKDYKFFDASGAGGYGFISPRAEGVTVAMQRMLSGVGPMSNLMWDVSSLQGAMALQTNARAILEPQLLDEIYGRSVTAPGRRIIDLLGVRYVSVDAPVVTPGFRVAYHDDQRGIWIMENTAALPRFQVYTRNKVVHSSEEALAQLATPRDLALIVEDTTNAAPVLDREPNDAGAIRFQVRKQTSTHYVIDVDAGRAGWLFLADANYPGWTAAIDGHSVPVYSAQVLGKAVAVPLGVHQVELNFSSASFRFGLLLTMVSILFALVITMYTRRARRVHRG